LDKSGNGYAVIRFLPAPKGEDIPWQRMFSHSFQGPGGWYIENSLTTINKNDPVGEVNRRLWNSGSEADKETARRQKRKLSYYTNIYVVTDTKAHDVAVSPDGKLAVACNVGAGNITFIDVAAKKAVHTMATGKKAITAVFSPDGNTLYVVNAGDATISVVDVKTHKITETRTGAKGAMAIKPTDNWGLFWLTAPADNKLLLMNPKTGAVEASIDVPGEPHGLVHSPDGKTVYVGQRKLGQIAMIDTASRKITKTTSLGQRPDMIAISSDGKTVYVAIRDENKLAVVSTADLSLTIKVDTDGETHGVAYRD